MGLTSLILLAVALAMDAFSVAVTDGIIIKNPKAMDALKIGLFFGAFQFLMPCIGSGISGFADAYIERFSHWIAFGLLLFLGAGMIKGSFEVREMPKDPLKITTLLLMAVATSIDALAAGVTLTAVDAPVIFSSIIIGAAAFTFSFAGVFIGRRFGSLLGAKAEIAGGVVLILIGIKILAEHLIY